MTKGAGQGAGRLITKPGAACRRCWQRARRRFGLLVASAVSAAASTNPLVANSGRRTSGRAAEGRRPYMRPMRTSYAATREAGKTLADGCGGSAGSCRLLRYYAAEAVKVEAGTDARGVIVCISPWNFPPRDFYRAGGCGARDGQRRCRQTRGTDAADCRACDPSCCTGRVSRKMCCICCRETGRASVLPHGRSADRGGLFHGLYRGCPDDRKATG